MKNSSYNYLTSILIYGLVYIIIYLMIIYIYIEQINTFLHIFL